MEKEHLILSYIQQQEDVTQRDIARNTGMGLGTVNILLKKMIKKGLVKIERLNARSLRYMLTPKGLKEKT
ncbi:MAG TPA: winged helix-turn-helix transcriptional regulator, partial [Firmicutes bacterium]|nr:winged helix-turn-helix transcriptional regulator [Bacillota bacterium]